MRCDPLCFCFFFFNDTATTEIYTLSLHDALPICSVLMGPADFITRARGIRRMLGGTMRQADRKSTRLNSSHLVISYAVFCLKKKKKNADALIIYLADVRNIDHTIACSSQRFRHRL